MPNSWDHHQPTADSTCIAPIVAPYGRWNVDEIITATVPSVFLITLWRIIFCYLLGNYMGGYVANREFPNPHPKPLFIDKETNPSKLKTLYNFYNKIDRKKSKVPKKKKKTESKVTTSDKKLTANIQARIEGKSRKKRKPLILPQGLSSSTQSPENLAFLASLDSDETRREIPQIMKDLDYTLTEIREYCHYEKDKNAIKQLSNKFNEEAWKAITMLIVTCYGIWVMSKEQFFSNPALLFQAWPQVESWRVFLYYQIAVGYHVHRALWQFWDKKRKDVIAMFIHHWVTVILIASSWYWGIMNIGALVMVAHDNADVLLPAAKMSAWLKWSTCKNIFFVCFVMSWILSRIVLFSWKVIIPVFIYAPTAYSCHYSKFVWFAAGLLVLLSLHIYWAYTILSVAVGWIMGAAVEDTRSSDEEDKEEIIIQPEEFAENEEHIDVMTCNDNKNDDGGLNDGYKVE